MYGRTPPIASWTVTWVRCRALSLRLRQYMLGLGCARSKDTMLCGPRKPVEPAMAKVLTWFNPGYSTLTCGNP
jgi:hypothetical protein